MATPATKPKINIDALSSSSTTPTIIVPSMIACIVLAVFGFSFLFDDLLSVEQRVVIASISSIFAVAAVIMAIVYFVKQNAENEEHIAQFLKDNNWEEFYDTSSENVATCLLGVGRNRRIARSFKGKYAGIPFVCSLYQYTIGGGKSQTIVSTISLQFKYPQILPHMTLDSAQNDTWVLKDMPNAIPKGHKLVVEGDFNKYYRIRIGHGDEQEVLTLLTPDFMQELIDQSYRPDIEIEAHSVFLVANSGNLFNAALLKMLFASSGVVHNHLHELSDSWNSANSKSENIEAIQEALEVRQRLARPYDWSYVILFGLLLLSFTFAIFSIHAIKDLAEKYLIASVGLALMAVGVFLGEIVRKH